MKILLNNGGTIMIQNDDGGLEMLADNSYTQVRFGMFEGGRISYDFGGGCVIQETYNRGIYNCECDGELIQIYDGAGIAEAIMRNDISQYRRIFTEWYSAEMESSVVAAAMAGHSDRIQFDGKMYVVDDVWAVTKEGGAMFQTYNTWKNLCLVATNTEERDIILPGKETPVRVNARTWVVIAKLIFLLYPQPEPVFMGQLPDTLKVFVQQAHEIFNIQ